MSISVIATRYSKAFFDATVSDAGASVSVGDLASKLNLCIADLRKISETITEDNRLKTLIASPLLKRRDGVEIIGELASKLNLHELTKKFLRVIAEHGRLALATEITGQFIRLVDHHNNKVAVSVTSAHPLDDVAKEKIAKECVRIAQCTQVSADYRIDPKMLGGLIVNIGSMQIDDSVTSKLNKIITNMKGA